MVLQRKDHAGGRGWSWFIAWLLTGVFFTFSLVAGFSIGLFFLPVVAAALLGVAWLSPHLREASGLLFGAAAALVAALAAFV